MTLYLASASPRRAALIKLLGVKNIRVQPSPVEEIFDFTESPEAIVQDLAYQKAEAALETLRTDNPHGIILGADTIVVLQEKILGKPVDTADAASMLRALSGHTHTVFTGVALLDSHSRISRTFAEQTEVTFRHIAEQEINEYIATGSPMDKAGAYGIQEDHGAVFVKKIVGDYYNVVGLPLCSVFVHLQDFAPDLFKK